MENIEKKIKISSENNEVNSKIKMNEKYMNTEKFKFGEEKNLSILDVKKQSGIVGQKNVSQEQFYTNQGLGFNFGSMEFQPQFLAYNYTNNSPTIFSPMNYYPGIQSCNYLRKLPGIN